MPRIMVVDDEATITMQLEERLTSMGYEVVSSASSGQEAVVMSRELKPDIVLMDIVMRGRLDGIDAAEIIKGTQDIPVIFLTGYADDKFIERAKNVNPYGYILKPYQEKEIKAAIEVGLHRNEMERRLRASEERYRSVVNSAREGIIISDNRANIISHNQAAETMFGYSTDEIIGKSIHSLVPERFRKDFRTALNQVVMAEQPEITRKVIETVGLRKSGGEFAMEISLTSWKTIDSVFFAAITRDMTELRKTQEQVRQSWLLASLGKVTAGIAHEVNNPLSSVLLYSELLLKSDVSGQTKKDLKVIHHEAKRAAKIMNALLAYNSHGLQRQIRCLNLHKILKKVLAMRRYQHRLWNVSVSINLMDDSPYVMGNSSQLMRVFMNLILNAEEALRESSGGNIIVTIQIEREWAKVSIADDGIGVPEEYLDQVFYPFFTAKKVREHIGLGLSMCYSIVTGYGGLIKAENNETGGATFTVELPLANNRR